MKAYGTPKTAMIHAQATFGGIGESCVTAIESLNVLYDEDLIGNSERVGAHLLERMKALQAKHPKLIKDVRGRGLMIGLEFQDFSQTLPALLRPMVAMLDDKLKGSLSGFVGALLLRDYNILVAFTEYNRNVIRLEPPLICTMAQADEFVDALDKLLSRGVTPSSRISSSPRSPKATIRESGLRKRGRAWKHCADCLTRLRRRLPPTEPCSVRWR